MANFLLALDPDQKRRDICMNSAATTAMPCAGLVRGECSGVNMQLIWYATTQAPVSFSEDKQGLAILWGDARREDGTLLLAAAELLDLWGSDEHRQSTILNGFFAGLTYHPEAGLVVGCDLLGVFPIYYYAGPDYLLVGTSPELFLAHPAFKAEFNPAGLVDVLLTMHSFNGDTMFKGVKRLAAGHHLIKGFASSDVKEERHYSLPVSTEHFSLPFSAQVDLLDEKLSDWTHAHATYSQKSSLLLSGGLDSRLLAGYLAREGLDSVALTLGAPEDIEMKCAAKVAEKMAFKHEKINIPYAEYESCAETQLRWEHLMCGFNNCQDWALYPHLRAHGQYVIMGHMLDAVIGTRYINWAYSAETKKMSFDNFFQQANAWGFRPLVLRELLRKNVFDGLVEDTLSRIRGVYDGYSDLESQKAWCFNLEHRQRFHVGSSAWACSFGAWPVIPALNHRLLTAAGSMPAATIAERRAQIELLCTRFPRLAALPLDRNSYMTRPLRPRLRYQLGQALLKHLTPLSSHHKHAERRFYVRTFDLNGPGWRAIRQRAERGRDCLAGMFNMDTLNQILPGPRETITLKNEIIGASGLKSLLGFMLWSERHL